jgi:hypothetical protein
MAESDHRNIKVKATFLSLVASCDEYDHKSNAWI